MLEKKWDESFINGIYGSSTRLIETLDNAVSMNEKIRIQTETLYTYCTRSSGNISNTR